MRETVRSGESFLDGRLTYVNISLQGTCSGNLCAGSVRFLGRASQEAPEETEGSPPLPGSPPPRPTSPPPLTLLKKAPLSQEPGSPTTRGTHQAPRPRRAVPLSGVVPHRPPPQPAAPRSPPPSRISATVLARRRGALHGPPLRFPPLASPPPGLTSEGAGPGPEPGAASPPLPVLHQPRGQRASARAPLPAQHESAAPAAFGGRRPGP